ncbi:unnamed protein product [Euphydryas editha]|uniref:Uncharacterized protein n=1 Tax=Euphydryas editha TaxID=104508 RepID=A0AAU9TFK9_EUPED|nr:unnamed protein product [Euphydryas editha]
MLLITFVIPLILIQSKVQAKNIIYVDEDYPQEIFNGPAINSDESLQQLNDKIYFNMYYPPIIRNSYNEKTNEQSHQENEQNPITEDQRLIPLILQVLVQGTVQAKNFIYVNEDYPQEIFNGPAINSDENLQLNDEIFYNMYPPLIMRIFTIILVQCTVRVSLTEYDYDDFDPNMEEINENGWRFPAPYILRINPDFQGRNDVIKGDKRDGFLSTYDLNKLIEESKNKKSHQKLVYKTPLEYLSSNPHNQRLFGVKPRGKKRYRNKMKLSGPKDDTLSDTVPLPIDEMSREYEKLKEKTKANISKKIMHPSPFMKNKLWVIRAARILRLIIKLIDDIKATTL